MGFNEVGSLNLEELTSRAENLLKKGALLSPEELATVYDCVYPFIDPDAADIELQTGRKMPLRVATHELGKGMDIIYGHLEDVFSFQTSNKLRFVESPGLRRHLWDTAFRARLMGLPPNVRIAALAHDLPEYRAHNLLEASEVIHGLGKYFKGDIITHIARMTDFSAVLIRDVFDSANGGPANATEASCRRILESRERGINHDYNATRVGTDLVALMSPSFSVVGRAVCDALKAREHENGKLVPVTASSVSDWIVQEALARANPFYARSVYAYAQEALKHDQSDYDSALLIKGLAHIDRLRTHMGDFSAIERASREAITFIDCLDGILAELNARAIVNNPLYFVLSVLKFEVTDLLRAESVNFARRSDTTSRYGGTILLNRLNAFSEKYANDNPIATVRPMN